MEGTSTLQWLAIYICHQPIHLHMHGASRPTKPPAACQSDEWDAFDEDHNIDDVCKIATLAQHFGMTSFRPHQKTVLDAAIAGKDTVVIQSTGSGKSQCYQFPALYTRKLSLVITPTVSLMKDQTDQLNQAGIPAAFVGSCQPDHSTEPEAFKRNILYFSCSHFPWRYQGHEVWLANF